MKVIRQGWALRCRNNDYSAMKQEDLILGIFETADAALVYAEESGLAAERRRWIESSDRTTLIAHLTRPESDTLLTIERVPLFM